MPHLLPLSMHFMSAPQKVGAQALPLSADLDAQLSVPVRGWKQSVVLGWLPRLRLSSLLAALINHSLAARLALAD